LVLAPARPTLNYNTVQTSTSLNISPAKAAKAQYSETEAAQLLGISVEELRTLVKAHIVNEEEPGNGAVTVFQSSDLLVLRILAGMSGQAALAS
jgi:hypothetical protein